MNTSTRLLVFALLSSGVVSNLCAAGKAAPATAPLPPSERAKIDINTADIPALESVTEIGTNFANAVVAARPFKSVDDLDLILKIGPEKMKTLRDKVTASPPMPAAASPTDNPAATSGSKPPAFNDGVALDRKEVTERYERTVKPKPAKPSEEKK